MRDADGHDPSPPCHAGHLPKDGSIVRHMLQHLREYDLVEGLVLIGQMQTVSGNQTGPGEGGVEQSLAEPSLVGVDPVKLARCQHRQ